MLVNRSWRAFGLRVLQVSRSQIKLQINHNNFKAFWSRHVGSNNSRPFGLVMWERSFTTQSSPSSQPTTTSFIDRKEVEDRVMQIVKNFDKVEKIKVSSTSNFSKDLGLDSLDQVEVVMAFEDEFKIEIPNEDADNIQSIPDAVNYIAMKPHAK